MPCFKVSSCCGGPSNSAGDGTKKTRCPKTKARFKKVWTVWTEKCSYIVTNGILPLADVTTDYLTYLDLVLSGDELFALGNLLIMFLPFAFKLGLVLSELLRGKCQRNLLPQHFAGLLLHLPFVSPIVHIFLGIRLLFFDHSDAAQSARIEQIQKVLDFQKPILNIFVRIDFSLPNLTRWQPWEASTRVSLNPDPSFTFRLKSLLHELQFQLKDKDCNSNQSHSRCTLCSRRGG